jgi:peptide/nickel transport system substrate-binding protein
MNKEIDLSLIDFSPRKVKWLKKNKKKLGLKIWEKESSNYKYLSLNHKNKHLKDINVRKSLSLILPRKDLLKYKLGDSAILSNGLFSPAFVDNFLEGFIDSYNPELAKSLLLSTGYKKGKSGFFEKNGDVLHLRWRISNNKNTVELVKTIKDYYEKFGIKISLIINEWGTYYKAFKKGNFDLTLGQWIGFTGPEFFQSLFHSQSLPPRGRNRGRYNNPEMDRLISEAIESHNFKKREKIFAEVQVLANRDYAYINLWHPKILWVGRNCLGRVKIFPNGSFYPLLKIRDQCIKEN